MLNSPVFVVFQASKPAVYSLLAFAPDNAGNILSVEQTITVVSPLPGPTPIPTPGPNPTPAHTVSLLAITDTNGCAFCSLLQPTLDKMVASGIPIRFLSAFSSEAVNTWHATNEPTLILLLDGKEWGTDPTKSRVIGFTPRVDATGAPVKDAQGHQEPNKDLPLWYSDAVEAAKNIPITRY